MENDMQEEELVPSGVITALNFSTLTEEDAVKTSVRIIEAASEVIHPALGLPNPESNCLTCGGIKRVKACEGHFGLIKFPCTIIDPCYVSEVVQILNKICPGCKCIRLDRVKNADSTSKRRQRRNCKYCDGSSKALYPTMKFKLLSKDMFGMTAIVAETNVKVSKNFQNKSSSGGLASDYWDIIPPDEHIEEISPKSSRRVLSHAQVYHLLKDIDSELLEGQLKRKQSIFLNCLLVTPNTQRITEIGQRVIFDDRTKAYRKLINFRGSPIEFSALVADCLKLSKIHSEKSLPLDSAPSMSGLKFIKEVLLGKRSDCGFRMVVVGDPNIRLDEIGVPCYIAERLQLPEQLNYWNSERLSIICGLRILEKGKVHVRRKGDLVCISHMDKLQIGDTVFRPLKDGDIVLINRPPSIHQHSLIALTVKVLPINSVLSINPLICSPLRGDFDGDCLHGYVPQSVDSRVELHELVALDKQLIDGQSGRNLLSLSQDSLTAAHLVLEDGVLLNLSQMQQLQMFCSRLLQLPAVIKAPSQNNCSQACLTDTCWWTGKQLFSLLLPQDFDFSFTANNVLINKGELISASCGSSWLHDSEQNLFHCLVKHCPGEALDILYASQEVLCEWLSMRGLSVSLSDLYLSSDPCSRTNLISEVSCGLQEAKQLSHIRLLMVDSNQDFLVESSADTEHAVNFGVARMCYEQQKSAALSQVSVSAFKQVFWDISNLVYQYASKDNSLMSMLKAGSKGNLMKLVQQCMCLGLQNSLVPLSFRIPHQLSCAVWNNQKIPVSLNKLDYIPEPAESFIPFAVVENSFLTGLNPLECFVHSLTSRDSSFSGHADISGTLSRRIMFFMRDLYVAYDGTVRNAYGNLLVQFSYNIDDTVSQINSTGNSINENHCASSAISGKPVGALAASAISEAAYSALDQPFSALESSPLLNLKKVLECGVRKPTGDKTASLYLSRKLRRWTHGLEYGALEVKNHLERLLLSDIVSSVMILFSLQASNRTNISPWVCHLHICKERMKRRRLKAKYIIDALYMKCNSARQNSKIYLPNLKIKSEDCSVADKQKGDNSTYCITVAVLERSKTFSVQLDILQNVVIPFLLGTVIKGFMEVKKVDILWKDHLDVSRPDKRSIGELYMRVFMSEECQRSKFWGILKDNCLQIMDIIDWERSHPDDIQNITSSYGVDTAWKYFVSSLKSAISDTGKSILPEHLLLTADCISTTGEFAGLNPGGLAQQRRHMSVSSPLAQACFSNPGDCFIKAAKMGVVDRLQGSLDALSWGKIPPTGTGGRFDIIYSGKGHELAKAEEVYKLLSNHVGSDKQNTKVELLNEDVQMPAKSLAQHLFNSEGNKNMLSKAIFRSFLSLNDIQKLSKALKHILFKYDTDSQLSEEDQSIVMMALHFHPRRSEKIGSGAQEIKVGYHSKHANSRCFQLVRKDGTVEDFSYHKCVHHALEVIAPQRAKTYHSKWLKGSM